jgi:hypothetical protein
MNFSKEELNTMAKAVEILNSNMDEELYDVLGAYKKDFIIDDLGLQQLEAKIDRFAELTICADEICNTKH